VREARELAAANSPVAHRWLELAGGEVNRITGPLITQLAQEGDDAAVELFGEVGQWLGDGNANLAAAVYPGTFVIGGGLSEAGELLLAPARDAFQHQLTGRRYRPEAVIVQASLGNKAGFVGAADLARPFARHFRRARARARERKEALLRGRDH
jgi:glucokinase